MLLLLAACGFLRGCLHTLPVLHVPQCTGAQCCTFLEDLSSISAPVMVALQYSRGPKNVFSPAECQPHFNAALDLKRAALLLAKLTQPPNFCLLSVQGSY